MEGEFIPEETIKSGMRFVTESGLRETGWVLAGFGTLPNFLLPRVALPSSMTLRNCGPGKRV